MFSSHKKNALIESLPSCPVRDLLIAGQGEETCGKTKSREKGGTLTAVREQSLYYLRDL
jgi:hypothetical protein